MSALGSSDHYKTFASRQTARQELDEKLDKLTKRPHKDLEEAMAIYALLTGHSQVLARDALRNNKEAQKENAEAQKVSWNARSVTVYSDLAAIAGIVGSGTGLLALNANANAREWASSAQGLGQGIGGIFSAASTAASNAGQGDRTVLGYNAERLRMAGEKLSDSNRTGSQRKEELLQRAQRAAESRAHAFSSMLSSR